MAASPHVHRQEETPGGHRLHIEDDTPDGHVHVILEFTTLRDEDLPPGQQIVGSELTGAEVWLNNCLIRDPEFGQRLYAEITGRRR